MTPADQDDELEPITGPDSYLLGRMAPDVPLAALQWCPRCKTLRPTTEENRGARMLCGICNSDGTGGVHVSSEAHTAGRSQHRAATWAALLLAALVVVWLGQSIADGGERPDEATEGS